MIKGIKEVWFYTKRKAWVEKNWVGVRVFIQRLACVLDAKGWPCTTCTWGPVKPIFLLAKAMAMRDKDNGKANVSDVDMSYEEVVAWRDDPSREIKPRITNEIVAPIHLQRDRRFGKQW